MLLPGLGTRSLRPLLVRLVANGIGQTAATWMRILVVREAFDRLVQARIVTAPGYVWPSVAAALGAAYCARGWLRRQERVDAERIGQQYVHRVRLRLFDHIAKLSPRVLQEHSHGAVMVRFVGDLSALRLWVSRGLATLVVGAITITGSLAVIAALNAFLAVTVALSIGTTALLVRWSARGIRDAAREVRRRRGHLATNVSEKVSAMAVVQVCGQTTRERRRLARQSRRLRDALIQRARLSGGLQGSTDVAAGFTVTAVLLIGANEVAAGRATHGTVVAAMLVARSMLPTIRRLGRVHEYRLGAEVALTKIRQLLATPQQTGRRFESSSKRACATTATAGATACVSSDTRNGAVSLHRVSVEQSLEGISGAVAPHARVALVGGNGAGKSTLLSVIAGLVPINQGKVRIDGIDGNWYDDKALRRRIGMVSPDLPLIRGTIAKNVCYRWPRAPEEEIRHVMRTCGVDAVVAELPDGVRTRLKDAGTNLSVGQRQRIALARAMLGTPPVLLLDEPEANLDQATRGVLLAAVRDYPGTVLWATHSPDTIAVVDEVWYLRGGRLLDVCTPDDTLAGYGSAATCLDRNPEILSTAC